MFEPTNLIIAHLGDKHELLSLISLFGLSRVRIRKNQSFCPLGFTDNLWYH